MAFMRRVGGEGRNVTMAALPLGRAGVHSCIRCVSTPAGSPGGQDPLSCRPNQKQNS